MGYNSGKKTILFFFIFLPLFFSERTPVRSGQPHRGSFMRQVAADNACARWCIVVTPLGTARYRSRSVQSLQHIPPGQRLNLLYIHDFYCIYHMSYIYSYWCFFWNEYNFCIFEYFFAVRLSLCIYVRFFPFLLAILAIPIIDGPAERGYNSFINSPSPVTWETRKGE